MTNVQIPVSYEHREPILSEETKLLIEAVNEDYTEEVLLCVRAFTKISKPNTAKMTTLFSDGLQVEVVSAQGLSSQFIPFVITAAPAEALRATVMAAMDKLGVKSQIRQLIWEVLDVEPHTPHFRRITFAADAKTLQEWQPGYACRFGLHDDPEGESRPYTLRRSNSMTGTAQVDVYCHHNTLGSDWASTLQMGRQIHVTAGKQEHFPDFSAGPALLFGDETALPTIAALLDGWAHESPVRVIVEVNDPAQQRYLDDICLPRQSHVSWIPRTGKSGDALSSVIADLTEHPEPKPAPMPVVAWGALESTAARHIRKQLREELKMKPELAKVVAYWRTEA